MKNKIVFMIIFCLFIMGGSLCMAEEKVLSKDEAIALFKDKTFDGYQEIKKKNFKVFSAPDGKHEVHFESGKTISRYWRINDNGEHCVSKSKGNGGRCSIVKSMGDGVYHKITDGEHTHTLRNFVDANQL